MLFLKTKTRHYSKTSILLLLNNEPVTPKSRYKQIQDTTARKRKTIILASTFHAPLNLVLPASHNAPAASENTKLNQLHTRVNLKLLSLQSFLPVFCVFLLFYIACLQVKHLTSTPSPLANEKSVLSTLCIFKGKMNNLFLYLFTFYLHVI